MCNKPHESLNAFCLQKVWIRRRKWCVYNRKSRGEVDSVEPRYKECDMKTGKITDWKINYDLKEKLIRPQCIQENYIYGFISEFSDTNREDDEELIAIKR